MPISFGKLFSLMEKKGITVYRLRKDKVIGTAAIEKMIGRQPGHVDTRSIERLCEYLNCQPGDIMEYKKEAGD